MLSGEYQQRKKQLDRDEAETEAANDESDPDTNSDLGQVVACLWDAACLFFVVANLNLNSNINLGLGFCVVFVNM